MATQKPDADEMSGLPRRAASASGDRKARTGRGKRGKIQLKVLKTIRKFNAQAIMNFNSMGVKLKKSFPSPVRVGDKRATTTGVDQAKTVLGQVQAAKTAPVVPSPTSEGSRTARELANEILQYPEQWLRTPNENLGNRKPIDLIDTTEAEKVSNLLRAVKYGMFS